MKKILSLITLMLLAVAGIFAQSPAPGILNYQGVARNSVGNVLVNKNISLRLTIRDGSAAGPTVYSETRAVTTNPFGLFNVQLGSPGASAVTGTIAGVPWGVGLKFIQVEIDPNGGSSFINIGTAQLASVPYSLYSTLANDLVLPFNKTQADAGSLFKVTNSGSGSGSTALEGITNSGAGNAFAVIGTVNNTSAGGFSAGVRGNNLSTTGLGIGVYGSQSGSGWGVYGVTPSGIGVNGSSNSGIGVWGTSTSGNAGRFEVNNVNSSNAVVLANGNTAISGNAIIVANSQATAGSPNLTAIRANNASTNDFGIGLWGGHNGSGWGVYGFASAGGSSNWAAGGFFDMLAGATPGGAAVRGNNYNTGGFAGHFINASGSASSRALRTQGAVQMTGINEGLNRILTSDASGNATWQNAAAVGVVTGSGTLNFIPKWTPSGTNLGNSLLFDNGSVVGIGTVAPTHRLDVTHGGATGIGVNSTSSFSVVDINAASGDAALRFASGSNMQWNIRNRPGDNYLEIFEMGGGGSRMAIQDGTGNVGIGNTTASISYRLHVEHGGSTGILSRSTSGFSLVDIDASNGDAALRFQSAGVNQWNVRNQPGTDNLQIFEMGGGGERMHIQNGTGNISIGGEPNPTYRLDVLHGGSTGTRIRSSSSFSVVDIDAASGDAALRFAKAGVNQWNIRNRPADDYLEIFELGGGGSRVVIQDGTGNVGIGATTSPSYKLDVEHGGSTGIRSKSTASFSVVDIDAASGDAALRFANNGTNQWNIRNRPADDYLEIFELGGGGSRVVIQDGTGNVGIGATTSPSYKLDVEHGGSTGIRSKSTGSFSVVDIDGASGDAALRFINAGVNQWNIRNQPGTDNLQIFELGGGGERMHIQNATGNVSIGGEASPSYRLDVLHGGATGARIRSSSTFSVVDIDANNGDAALRFVKNGVNQWNTRNNPVTDDYQIFELGGGGERMRIENTTGNVVISSDLTVLGAKLFTMDHPLDPANKLLRHAAAESNEVINFYSGNVTTDANGKAVVSLPDYFEAINKDFRYQLTVIGSFAQAIISKEVSNNQFEIATSVPNVKVSWEVKGVRNDARMIRAPFVAEIEKSATQKGQYWDPASHHQPASKMVGYDAALESSLNHVPKAASKPVIANSGGSLDEMPKAPAKAAPANTGGSLDDMPKAPAKAAPANTGGSLEDMPKAPAKAAPANTGGSLDEMPKPAVKTQEVKAGEPSSVNSSFPVAKPAEVNPTAEKAQEAKPAEVKPEAPVKVKTTPGQGL